MAETNVLFSINVVLTTLLLSIIVVLLVQRRFLVTVVDAACLFNGLVLFQTIHIAKISGGKVDRGSKSKMVLRASLVRGFLVVIFGIIFSVVMMASG
jgi:asparagine N-glycosylation enzyme membrane subunit Stt3